MIATIIIALIIAAVSGFIVFDMINKKRQGKGGCGCGCSECSMSGICHEKNR